ncbi:MAG: hypothetical protein WDO56_00205 [Gammaproteobacteria bacterium]
MWKAIGQMVEELKRCEAAEADVAAVALIYIYIDTFAFLAMPEEQEKQTRTDFQAWVDTYLKGDPAQPYQYRGIDVYGARCALLHSYGSEADYHGKNEEALMFAYSDGGKHAFDPNVHPRLVIIGIPSFINDMVHAIGAFVQACQDDLPLRARVSKRLPKVLTTLPFVHESQSTG